MLTRWRKEKRTKNIKHKISSELKNSASLKVKRNEESCNGLLIEKVIIKSEFISDPKHIISIINVYATTSQLVGDDVSIVENFYNDATTVLNELKNKSLVFLTGDWNAKVGKKIKQHASDVRNNSGQYLINFCPISNLFISNKPFQSKAAHISNYMGKQTTTYSAARKSSTLSSMPEVSAIQKHQVIIASSSANCK